MFYDSNRLNIIIGAYGSGKSEISVNIARLMKKSPEDMVLLADMDIVNPYYRSADAKDILESDGIRVIVPSYANSNVDAPVLTGEIYVIFDDERYKGVFDIGGEDMGANVLGSLKSRIAGTDCGLYMVVNTLRPFTADIEGIAREAAALQDAAGMKITGYINNTNLLEDTTEEAVREGEALMIKAAELTGIPLVATAVYAPLLTDKLKAELKAPEVFPVERTIHYKY